MTDLESIQRADRIFAEARRITRCQKLEGFSMLVGAFAACAAVAVPTVLPSTKAGATFFVAAFAVSLTAGAFSLCLTYCLRD